MSRILEEKIVALRMDDRDFKDKGKGILSFFDRFKSHIKSSGNADMRGTISQLDQVGNKVKQIKMDALQSAVDSTKNKFSALEVVATGALLRIGSSVADTAGKLVRNALGIDDLRAGFSEYEQKIDSISTIKANTGASTKEVAKYLDELNKYADQTVYSFGDMTRAIGFFTAAGVGLDKSVPAIKGLSNLAATVGANNQSLQTLQYQISQALSSGVVRLQDWRSVENAGMGGKLFRDALVKEAKEAGTLTGKALEKYTTDGFRNSLSEEWLTADVLTNVLNKFASDQTMLEAATKVRSFGKMIDTIKESIGSGWGRTFELLFGDFDQATALWSGITNAITKYTDSIADKRNKLLEGWNHWGGRDYIINGFKAMFSTIDAVASGIGQGIERIFKPLTGLDLVGMSKAFHDFWVGLLPSKWSHEYYHMLDWWDSFSGILANVASHGLDGLKFIGQSLIDIFPTELIAVIIDIIWYVAEFISMVGDAMKPFDETSSTIKNSGKSMNEFFKGIRESMAKWWHANRDGKFKQWATNVAKALQTLDKVFSTVGKAVGTAFGWIFRTISDAWKTHGSSIKDIGSKLGTWLGDIWGKVKIKSPEWLATLKDVFSKVWEYLKPLGEKGWDGIVAGFNYIKDKLIPAIADVFKGFEPLLGAGWEKIKGFFKTLGEWLSPKAVHAAGEELKPEDVSVKEAGLNSLGRLVESIKKFYNEHIVGLEPIVNGFTVATLKLAIALVAIMYFKKKVDQLFNMFGSIGKFFDTLGGGLAGMFGSIKGFFDTLNKNAKNKFKMNALLKIVGALAGLTILLKILGNMSVGEIQQGGMALAMLSGLLVGILYLDKIISNLGIPGTTSAMEGLGKTLLGFSAAIISIAIVARLLRNLQPSELDNLKSVMIYLGFFLTNVYGIIRLLGIIPAGEGNFHKMAGTFFGLAGLLFVMGRVAKTLSGIDPGLVQNAIGNMWSFIGMISVVLFIGGLAQKIGGGAVKLGGVIAALSAFMLIGSMMTVLLGLIPEGLFQTGYSRIVMLALLIGAVEVISGMAGHISGRGGRSLWKTMLSAIFGIIAVAGAVVILGIIPEGIMMQGIKITALIALIIGALTVVVGLANRLSGEGSLKGIFGSLMAIVTSMVIIGFLVEKMGSIDDSVLLRGIAVVAGITLFAGALVFMTTKMTKLDVAGLKTMGLNMLAAVLSLVALAGVIYLLGQLDPDVMWGGALVVASLTVALGLISKLMSAVKGSTKVQYGLLANMAGLVIGTVALALAVASLSRIPWTSLAKGAVTVGVLAIVVAKLAEFGGKLNGGYKVKWNIIAQLATSLVGVLALAYVVTQLGTMNVGQLMQGMAAIVVLGVVVSALQYIGQIIGKAGKASFENAAQMISIAVSMVALSYVLQTLASMDPTAFVGALVGMIVVYGLLFLASQIASKFGDVGAGHVGLIATAVSMFLVAQAIKAINSVGIMEAIVSILLLIGAIAILSVVAPAVSTAGFAMLPFAAACIAIGAGANLLVEAFETMFNGIGQFIGGILDWFKDLIGAGKDTKKSLDGVKESAAGISSSGGTGGEGGADGFADETPTQTPNRATAKPKVASAAEINPNVYEPAKKSLTKQSTDFSKYVDKLPGGYGNKIKMLQGLDMSNPQAAMKAMKELTGDAKGLGDVMQGLDTSNMDKMFDDMKEFMSPEEIAKMKAQMSELTGAFQSLAPELQTALDDFRNAIANGTDFDTAFDDLQAKFEAAGIKIPEGFKEALKSAMDSGNWDDLYTSLTEANPDMSGVIGNILTQLSGGQWKPKGSEVGGQFASGVSEGASGASGIDILAGFLNTLAGASTTAAIQGTLVGAAFLGGVATVDYGTTGTIMATALMDGVNTQSESFKGAGTTFGGQFVAGVASVNQNANSAGITLASSAKQGASTISMNSTGSDVGKTFASGVSSTSGDAAAAGSAIAGSARANASVSLYGEGMWAGMGFAGGLIASVASVAAAAYAVAAAAKAAITSTLSIHSPSRVMFGFGAWTGKGFGNGILSTAAYVFNAAKKLAGAVMDATNSEMDSVVGSMPEFNPTVKPIVDMSNVTAMQTALGGEYQFSTEATNGLQAALTGGTTNIHIHLDKDASDYDIRRIAGMVERHMISGQTTRNMAKGDYSLGYFA